MKIEGSIALVTGANGGIGRALVAELLKRGAKKIYLGVRDTAVDHGFPNDARLFPVKLDLTDEKQIAAAAAEASDVNLLINNAGYTNVSGALGVENLDAARREMEVNYFGPLALTRAFRGTPVFNDGAILNILSFLSLVTLPLAGTYSASKAAALALTRTLQAELKNKQVVVVAAMPIQMDTAMGDGMPEPKVQPAEAASDALDAVEAGQEIVFPGELSRGAAATYDTDPKGIQAYLASLVHEFV